MVEQLIGIIEKIDLNTIGVKQKLEKEMERLNQFRNKVLGLTEEEITDQKKLDLRAYAKYILKEGTIEEKRELMQSFKSKLILIDRKVVLG